jgi:glyoxylase-like metal-dependent hydrolase (beta-lactamase superfamily II)
MRMKVLARLSLAALLCAQSLPETRMLPTEMRGGAVDGNQIGSSGLAGGHTRVLFGDPSKAGFYSILLFVPAHTTIQAHSHRDDRMATVVSGSWYFGYGDRFDAQSLKKLPPGSVYSEPGAHNHFARTDKDAVIAEISGYGPTDTRYFNPADEPKLAEWVEASGKNLTTIHATHGHGDHFFGVNTIQLRFPNARFVASRDAISVMRGQLSASVLEAFWKSRIPGQIDATLPIAEDLAGDVIELEGEELVSIPTGHTDTRSTTCLHVHSIGLVVAGDAAHNDVHVHLGESTGTSRQEWIAALHMIGSLKPRAVVAGHKRPGRPDAPDIIGETKQYIRDFDTIAATTRTAKELYDQMVAIYPGRVNPAVLWNSARAVKV